jgi:ABC-type uncharacterized transport system substrate-binding protein
MRFVRNNPDHVLPTVIERQTFARNGTSRAYRDFAVAGGLVSYSASLDDTTRQGGIYTGKILNGAKPADLPAWQPTKFELVINLKTGRALQPIGAELELN